MKLKIIYKDAEYDDKMDCYFSKLNQNTPTQWPFLSNRFQVLNIIGKGGFAEVYKAFDVIELKYVVLKLNILNDQWDNQTKELFIKYAKRENDVFQTLNHPNIVQYQGSLQIADNVLCTVLEYCEGPDLDKQLKSVGRFSEKEA